MKTHAIKHALLLLTLALICLCGNAKTTFSQGTGSSSKTDEQRRIALVNALERAQDEVVAGRKYIDGLKEQVKSKEVRIDALNKRDEKRVEIEKSLNAEISNLRAAIEEQKSALKVKEDEVGYLKKELSKVQKKLNSSHTREKVLVVTTIVLFLLQLLK